VTWIASSPGGTVRAGRSAALIGCLAITLASCAHAGVGHTEPVSAAPSASPGAGHLIIVGGGPRPAAIMDRFIELAGGVGEARIAVVPMASGNPESAGESLVEEMLALGAADAFVLHVDRDEAMRPETADRLDGATGVWFSGGSQTRHTAALKDTPVEARLHEMLREGVVLGGTSAGAAIMSERMITGGERRPGGDRPRDEAWITIDRDNVVTEPGFGFLPGAIVDQHFVRRKRHNRLIALVFEHPEDVGVGIDEATALHVGPDGRWTVLGDGVVVIYDARDSQVVATDSPLGASGVRMHVLPHGATFDPRTGEASLAQRVTAGASFR
jgi:cyanophycinase